MLHTFTIPGRLPSLNEYINKCRHNRYSGAAFKKKTDKIVQLAILAAGLKGKMFSCVKIYIAWYERDRRRDIDNIKSANKYVLDAMVSMRVIPDDKQKHVKDIKGDVFVDAANPRVEVTIEVLLEGEQSLF